jgi:hypothetical protein
MLPEGLPLVPTSVSLVNGEAPGFAERLVAYVSSDDQKRIFRANWILRPSLALVIFPRVGGEEMLLPGGAK